MNNEINRKLEAILGSLDGVKRATTPDFFYTRLKARMEKGYETATPRSWMFRPVYAMAALVVVVLVNAAVIYNGQSTVKENIVPEIDISQTVAAEYSLNDNSVNLYDLNMDK